MTNTILVNKDNKIKSTYQKKLNLIKIENFKDDEIYIEEETYKSYLLLKKKLQEKNIEIGIITVTRNFISISLIPFCVFYT